MYKNIMVRIKTFSGSYHSHLLSQITFILKFYVFSFSSSGLTINGAVSLTSSSREGNVPQGKQQLNDIALNENGVILYTAAGDRVRVWDLRR